MIIRKGTIIFAFAENHEWDYEDGDLTVFLCESIMKIMKNTANGSIIKSV